eukprot:8936182-Lingulodinium_polyedra.AAC.1
MAALRRGVHPQGQRRPAELAQAAGHLPGGLAVQVVRDLLVPADRDGGWRAPQLRRGLSAPPTAPRHRGQFGGPPRQGRGVELAVR